MTSFASGSRTLGQITYQAIFDHSLDGVLFTIPDGRILAANPAACQLLGRSEAEVCAAGRQGLADPTDPRWIEGLDERRRTGRTRRQVRMIRGDGSVFEADLSSAIFETPDGDRRACVIFHDLSERIAAAQQLALLEDRDRIARNLHDLVMRRISTASMHAHSLLGQPMDAVVHQRVGDLVAELDETIAGLRKAIFRLGSESERRYQTLVENSSVAVVVVRSSDSKVVFANGRAVAVCGATDPDELLSRRGDDLVPEDLRPWWRGRLSSETADGAMIRPSRVRVLRFDGREVEVGVSATPVIFDGEAGVQVELYPIAFEDAAGQ